MDNKTTNNNNFCEQRQHVPYLMIAWMLCSPALTITPVPEGPKGIFGSLPSEAKGERIATQFTLAICAIVHHWIIGTGTKQ